MPFIARQRSRLAVLAVLALVGSLLAVSAVPVAAADGTVDHEATYSACVGAATVGAGFGDMAGSFAEDAANCLAHYGITTGTAAGVFSPNASITRLQMALFLTRAAGPAGIVLPAASDQGLTDIGGMTQGIQDAINQAAELGIMSSRSAGVFDPTGMVTREDMAVHLAAFLSDATTGPGGKDIDKIGATGTGALSEADDTVLTDISGVTFSAYGAIRDLYELGVTTGTSDTTFSPSALVSRGQMAVFITRALAHTNARPAGLTIQGDSSGETNSDHSLRVSIRDSDHQPVPDAIVDIFSSASPDQAFDVDGACVAKHITGDCTAVIDDFTTDPDGNSDVTVSLSAVGSLTVWAWTGDDGDKFDEDEDDSHSIEVDVSKPATATKVTNDMKEHAVSLKFGDTVTYTLQLVNDDGDPVATEGLEFTIVATVKDSSGRPDTKTTSTVYTTDAAGRIEVSYSADDPDPDSDNQDLVELNSNISEGSGSPEVDMQPMPVDWSDNDAKPTTLALAQAVEYHETDDDGAHNTVTATLVDQYGDPVGKVKVALWSGAKNADGESEGLGGSKDAPADRRTTSSASGVATKRYSRSVLKGATETVEASYVIENGKCLDSMAACMEKDDVTLPSDPNAVHYWAARIAPKTGDSTITVAEAKVLVADTDNNTVVIGEAVELANYKSGDHFYDGVAAVDLDVFEERLDVGDTVTITIGNDEDDINTFKITKHAE